MTTDMDECRFGPADYDSLDWWCMVHDCEVKMPHGDFTFAQVQEIIEKHKKDYARG